MKSKVMKNDKDYVPIVLFPSFLAPNIFSSNAVPV